MDNIAQLMSDYATKETMTVVAALATAWIGWKAAAKAVGMAQGFATKASFAGLTSAILVIAGFGGLGIGIGELATRTGGEEEQINRPDETQLTNDQLIALATNKNTSKESLEEILQYTTARDMAARASAAHLTDEEGRTWILEKQAAYMPVASSQPYEELPFEVFEQEESAINEESIMSLPQAWSSIGFGLACLISGFSVFTTRRLSTA